MKPVKSFVVKAALPKHLEPLRELAYNVSWSWNPQTINLLYRLDRNLWEKMYHNPVSILGNIPQSRLEYLAKDEGFNAQLARVKEQHERYVGERGKRTL